MSHADKAQVRDQRESLAEHLASPPPIKYQGKDWEFVRVDGNDATATVYLRPAGSQDQFVTRSALANGTAFLEDTKTGSRRALNLSNETDKEELERLMKPGKSYRSGQRLLFRYVDENAWQRARLNGTDPEPRMWRIGVSVHSDLVRLKYLDAQGIRPQGIRVPLQDLGRVPVRLKGEERDGVYHLSLDSRGKLVASKEGDDGKMAMRPVRPDDVVGEYVNYPSNKLGKVPIKSTRVARGEQMTGARLPQGAVHASPSDALSAYGMKPLSSQDVMAIKIGQGDKLIQQLTKFVEELEPKTPLVIRQWRFDDGPADKKSAFMQNFVRAVCNHARSGAPVDLVLSRGKLSPSMESTLADAGVRVHIADNLPHKMVVHQKSLATPDKSIIYTGPFDPKATDRMEMMVALSPALSARYYEHEFLAVKKGGAVAKQQEHLAGLAEKGVVVDRPEVSAAYAARSYWALTRGAQKSIELYVKELSHPEFTKLLIDKAQQGVSVKIRLAENKDALWDNASQRLVLAAKRENPDLGISIKSYNWNAFPYRHFNAIIADNELGAFGTSYPWSNGLGQIDPAGSGTEHCLILDGENLANMRDAMRLGEKKLEHAIEKSGGVTYSTVNEVPTISLLGFRGAGTKDDLLAPDSPHPYQVTGHVGYKLKDKGPIYGFGPNVSDEIPHHKIIESLKQGERYPGQITNDTDVFRAVATNPAVGRDGNPQVVIEQKIPFLRPQFERIKKEHNRLLAAGPSTEVLYGFPSRKSAGEGISASSDGKEPVFNCATFPKRLGIPIPEKTGNMRKYMTPLAEAGRPWKPNKAR